LIKNFECCRTSLRSKTSCSFSIFLIAVQHSRLDGFYEPCRRSDSFRRNLRLLPVLGFQLSSSSSVPFLGPQGQSRDLEGSAATSSCGSATLAGVVNFRLRLGLGLDLSQSENQYIKIKKFKRFRKSKKSWMSNHEYCNLQMLESFRASVYCCDLLETTRSRDFKKW
jgi:hypothetical protein